MTPTRTEINRSNAKHSTGPKTKAGKKRSSLNALRHGLTGQLVVMPDEDLAAYQRHLESFADEYKPQGPTESHLVQVLADTSWRLNRIVALETNLLDLAAPQPDIAAFLERQSKVLSNLSLYTQRLSRQFENTVAQIRELQSARRARAKDDLESLLDIMDMYEAKGEPYDPTEDGFDFSEAEVDNAILARNREYLAAEAYMYQSKAA
jgi:ABC-type transporter Mla subunit MlaD